MHYLREFFSYKGRMARLRYFLICLTLIVIFIFFQAGIMLLFGIFDQDLPIYYWLLDWLFNPQDLPVYYWFLESVFLSVILFFPTVKRLHDIEWSGWMYILLLILGSLHLKNPGYLNPFDTLDYIIFIINLFIFCFLIFVKGTKGSNKYGPDPLETK